MFLIQGVGDAMLQTNRFVIIEKAPGSKRGKSPRSVWEIMSNVGHRYRGRPHVFNPLPADRENSRFYPFHWPIKSLLVLLGMK